jgi:hypothetical protein
VKARTIDRMISRETIAAAEQLIRPHIRRTPVIEVDGGDFWPRLDPRHS